jgi:hypothetical protein
MMEWREDRDGSQGGVRQKLLESQASRRSGSACVARARNADHGEGGAHMFDPGCELDNRTAEKEEIVKKFSRFHYIEYELAL